MSVKNAVNISKIFKIFNNNNDRKYSSIKNNQLEQ